MSEKQKDRSMSSENFLIVKNLTHIYSQGKKNLKILDNINLKLCKGEMVALVGPSGAGKTTILNLVGLLDEVQKGEIILEDELRPKGDGTMKVPGMKPTWQRWHAMEVLDANGIEYDNVALVDIDTMVHWDCPDFFEASGIRLIPTSIIEAPSLTISFVTK